MRIETIPAEIDELLYDWQRHEIMRKVKAPIVAVLEDTSDPVWVLLDDLMVAINNVLTLGRDGETACSVHEILPGHYAVWLMDDYKYADNEDSVPTSVLISAQDLAAIRDGGMSGLVHDSLFSSF